MKISFVIPAYNEQDYIGDCLDAILKEKRANNYNVEIIVVNNASTDGTAAAIKKYPEAILVDEPKKGIVNARHAGLQAATGDLIANVDADTRITPGWLAKVMTAFGKDSELVAISGPFIYYDAPRKVKIFTHVFYYIGYFFYLLNRFVFRIGSMLQGGNFVVRRTALEKIGGYNTDLSFYGEDADVARRLNRVGKVRFTFSLPAFSSSRRVAKEGGLTMGLRYGINYFWIMFFKKPFTKTYVDVRFDNKAAVIQPAYTVKEWMIAISAVFLLLFVLLGGAFVIYSLAETGTISAINFIRLKTEAQNEFTELSSSTKNMLQENYHGNSQ